MSRLADTLTDSNGDGELIEILTLVVVLAFVFVICWQALHGIPVSPQDIGIGGGSLLAGNGVGNKFKGNHIVPGEGP